MTKDTTETGDKRKNRGICHFLLSLLEDESYPHVQWTNKAKGEFQIHWMHASSGAWVMNTDAETFRLWAKAKGKLEGRESNYKTWKANFRCAMKSRHELEEIRLPKSSSYRKKNIKLWKFNDMELINRYKEGEKFDWRRPRTKSSPKKSLRTLRKRRNKRTVNKDEQIESEENASSSHHSFDSCEPQCSSIPSSKALQSSYDTEELTRNEQLPINMEDDSDFSSYGAGLLQILEHDAKDTDSVVPNMPFGDNSTHLFPDYENNNQTENISFQQYNQLPPFHQLSSPFSTEQTFSENLLLEQDWELFGDEEVEKELKRKGIPTSYLDITSNDVADGDPFIYESTYMEL